MVDLSDYKMVRGIDITDEHDEAVVIPQKGMDDPATVLPVDVETKYIESTFDEDAEFSALGVHEEEREWARNALEA